MDGLLVLDGPSVRALAPPDVARAAAGAALVDLYRDGAEGIPRISAATADGELLLMPSAHPRDGTAVKLITLNPGNAARGEPTINGLVVLFAAGTGRAVALLDGAALTGLRTAAVSAAGTDRLARPDATRLAVVGTGVQARSHLAALWSLRPWSDVRVVGRDPDAVAAVVGWSREHGVPAGAGDAGSVAAADVVCTVTAAAEPVLSAADVAPGTHVTAVGSHHPDRRELAGDLVGRAEVFVEQRAAALREAGDLLLARDEGLLGPDVPWVEIGAVLDGAHPGRSGPSAVTVFKTVGLAAEDHALAAAVHRLAVERRRGERVRFG